MLNGLEMFSYGMTMIILYDANIHLWDSVKLIFFFFKLSDKYFGIDFTFQ